MSSFTFHILVYQSFDRSTVNYKKWTRKENLIYFLFNIFSLANGTKTETQGWDGRVSHKFVNMKTAHNIEHPLFCQILNG